MMTGVPAGECPCGRAFSVNDSAAGQILHFYPPEHEFRQKSFIQNKGLKL